MEHDNSGRRHKSQGDGSGLFPDNIYDIIVSFLPIRDAIRSSLVSRAWRFRWRSIPYLVFNEEDSLSNSISEASLQEVGQSNQYFISRVLLLHEGPIKKFEVSLHLQDDEVMDVWIPALTVSGIEQFIFNANDPEYLVHPELFSIHGLTTLKLFNCTVLPPSPTRLKGFPNLTQLVLQYVFIHEAVTVEALGFLITSCPMLERLSLGNIVTLGPEVSRFNVSAPSLKLLELDMEDTFGCFHMDAPNLSSVKLSATITPDDISYEEYPNCFSLINMLPSFKYVETLVIESIGNVPIDVSTKFPFELPYLKHLELHVFFEYLGESITAICLLRSAPMLKSLHVKDICEHEPEGSTNSFLGEHDREVCKSHYLQEGCKLDNLQLLRFLGMKWSQEETMLFKFVLENAVLLSKIDISTESNVGRAEHLVEDLLTVKKDTAHGILCINDMKVSF